MITCTVCGTPNEDLAIVCSSCRSYLQGKVDTLNLFQTIWGLAEAPRATMRRVLLARHKNYTLFLSALLGIACAYGVFWLQNAGARFDTIVSLTLGGIAWRPVFGVLFTALLASVAWAAPCQGERNSGANRSLPLLLSWNWHPRSGYYPNPYSPRGGFRDIRH